MKNLRPWKGKVSKIVFVSDTGDPMADAKKILLDYKKRGLHKRRTVESITVTRQFNFKL